MHWIQGTAPRSSLRRLVRLRSLGLAGLGRRAVGTGRGLVFGEFVVVLHLLLQPIQLRLELGHQVGVGRIVGQVVQLVRVVHQVVALPLVLLPEVDQLVRLGADAVMGPRVVVARVVVVAVVPARAPVGGPLALEQRQEAAALHVGGHLQPGDLHERRREIDVQAPSPPAWSRA